MLLTVDTLDFAVPNVDEKTLFQFFGLNIKEFEYSDRACIRNYSYSYYCRGIIFCFGGTDKYSAYVRMSGKGCRTFEDFKNRNLDWLQFLKDLMNFRDVSFRRIDIACDIYSDLINVRKLNRYLNDRRVAGACKISKMHADIGFTKEIFYAGSEKSVFLLRVYNKAFERGYIDGLYNGKPWYRAEIQLRDRGAFQFICEWCQCGDLAKIYSGHLLNQVRFLKYRNDFKNSQRIPTASFWKQFLGDVEKIKFVKSPGSEYNMTKLQRYLQRQVASSVKAYTLAMQLKPEELYQKFTSVDINLNEDQLALVNYYKEKKLFLGFEKLAIYNELFPDDELVSDDKDEIEQSMIDAILGMELHSDSGQQMELKDYVEY